MDILKFKKLKNDLYELYLSDGSTLKLYEDVILKYELLLKKSIFEEIYNDVLNYNDECNCYYIAVKSISSRIKSIYDCKIFLQSKEFNDLIIDKTINKLIKQGYLDDRRYASCYINNKVLTTNNGPNKIKKELLTHRVELSIIDEEMLSFSDECQLSKIDKIISKMIKSNHSKGSYVLKNKIVMYLINLGYDNSKISQIINKYEFNNNLDIAKNEYDKLYKRLSKKYTDKELDLKIKEKLYQKGLSYEI